MSVQIIKMLKNNDNNSNYNNDNHNNNNSLFMSNHFTHMFVR